MTILEEDDCDTCRYQMKGIIRKFFQKERVGQKMKKDLVGTIGDTFYTFILIIF